MSYALITGASQGIGKAIAQELAARKINLLLVARNEAALRTLAENLRQQHGVEAYYHAADLSLPGAATLVADWCRNGGYSIRYLVNNAGYGLSGAFEDYPLDAHRNMMQVNMNAVVELTYLMLPMLKKGGGGYIMNIASSAAYQAVPFLGVYAASKAFVLQFSRALHYELKKDHISVTCISPGATKTGFDARANLGPKALKAAQKVHMQPEAVARVAVSSMLGRKPEVVVGWLNKLGAALVWLMPKKLVEGTAAKIYQ